jgi:hypothetical protein
MAGRIFDAQVVLSPKDSPRGQLMSQYVCARIPRLDQADLGLFDYDRNNTLYYFIMNADEYIYMRYGGRDSVYPDSYLNLSSLELALEQGLKLHRKYQQGQLPPQERPKPLFARDIPLLVERTVKRGACVECHLVGDFQNLHREEDGTLDKIVHLYRSPDIKTIGIHLEVPKGLLVKEARGAAAAAGMQPGDRITALNGTTVWTFGDLQYYYDKVDRRAQEVRLTVARGEESRELTIALPERWWFTDTGFRQSTVDPRVYFTSRPLTGEEKRQHGLKPGGFAGQVDYVDSAARMLRNHELQLGDIVFRVDGAEEDEIANTPELFIKLRKTAGDVVTLELIRGGQRQKMELKTSRMSFRK